MERKVISKVNEYMFNKKESVVIVPSFPPNTKSGFASDYEQVKMVSAMLCNLHELGYTIPKEDLHRLWYLSPDDLNRDVYQPLLQQAKEAKGAHVEHRLLFPGFPESVKTLDIDTLSDIRFASYFTTFIDSVRGIDALSDGSLNRTFVEDAVRRAMDNVANYSHTKSKSWALNYINSDEAFYGSASSFIEKAMEASGVGFKEENPRAIRLVGEQEYFDMVRNMLSARTSLSVYDQAIVRFTIDNFDKSQYMPDKIQFRETQTLVDKYNFQNGHLHNIDVRTVADFERLLVSLSDGDTSLSKKQMVRNFSNQERKKLFEIFNNGMNKNWPVMVESAANRQTLRFMDNVLKGRLHFNQMSTVDEHGHRLSGAYEHFAKAARDKESIMAIYERNMREHKYGIAANVLAKHSPTLFVQHAREIIGKAYAGFRQPISNKDRAELNGIMKNLAECAKKVDVKTLLSLEKEIMRDHEPYKIMFPKGAKLDVLVKENKSVILPDVAKTYMLLAIDNGIEYQMKRHEMAGKVQINQGTKVYIDPELVDCPIPTVGRNDSGKNRTVATGTKLPVEKGDVIRAALYKQNDRDQFIDFSCGFMDKNYRLVGQTSWNNLQQRAGGGLVSYHSGDTMACSGKGCTEIIDVDLNAAKSLFPEAKYVVYTAVMWESNPLSSCNQLFMTLAPTQEMGKEDGQNIGKGYSKVYDPADVQFKVDITGDGFMSIPMLYDIETGKAMIVNIDTKMKDLRTFASNARHFDLPRGCECLENYTSDLAIKCFAYSQLNVPTIHDLAILYATNRGAEIVQTPGEADVIFATDRMQIDDVRPREEGEELVEQVIVTPFDKDIITAELIPDPKVIDAMVKKEQEMTHAANKEKTGAEWIRPHGDDGMYRDR